jgi:hypothetical protein
MGLLYQLTGVSKMKCPAILYEKCEQARSVEELKQTVNKLHLCHYEHLIVAIYTDLSAGNEWSRDLFTKLRNMFYVVERIWDQIGKTVAPKRKSFISYTYVLRKLCERLKIDHLLVHLRPIKVKKCKRELDRCWAEIEKHLNWDNDCRKRKRSFINEQTPNEIFTKTQKPSNYSRTLRLHLVDEETKARWRQKA